MNYLNETQTVWFAYKEAVKNTTRPTKCVVDFVDGFNAGKGTPMAKATKIVLEQEYHDVAGTKYKVKKLVNRVEPEVGKFLSKADVLKLQTDSENLTIEITEAKR